MSGPPLSGKTAVVTGASSGIGRAVAERLGAAGAHVVLSGRTEDAMQASVVKIVDAGGTASIHVGDVRDPAVVHALIDRAVAETGRLDIMVNNAGLSHPEPILESTVDKWKAMLETNILALLVGCQASVKAMRACGAEGHIVNMSSVAAQRSESGVYGSTKHAVNTISSSLRQELMEDSISVTSIMPGAIATNFARNMDPALMEGMIAMSGIEGEFHPGERIPDEILDAAQAALSELLASPEDVAEAVYFAVTQPARVHISEIVVRPKRDLSL